MNCAGANLVPCRGSVQASDQYILLTVCYEVRLEKKKVLISNGKKVKSFRGFKIACVCVIMKYDPLIPFVFAVRISSTSGRFKVVSVERGMGAL